jgi:hypothetical protein
VGAAIPSRPKCRIDAGINGKKEFAVFSDPITPGSTITPLALPFIANKSLVQSP